ncbi:hypothetical protein HCG49_18015 [Arenibacter sp. 6A1]|uniref:hypothetical protein n=1 Tax=Arenibacter sp. 6A1 TaxID=2720391 RepID=UPI001447FF19|nr:hypothetical protein [Arenibacter sp. 6A1]NKI28450.1 hypothetical protein [Arenibacter sp. 6A1]
MMRWSTFIIVLAYLQCFSQNVAYDSLYNSITKELLSTSPVKALLSTEHLYKISSSEREHMSALLLRAWILRQHGLKNEAIKLIRQADGIYTNNFCIASLNGFLSTLYRENGITWLGKRALNKAIEASKKIERNEDSFRFQGNLQQELAYYAMEEGEQEKAIASLQLGKNYFNKIERDSTILFHLSVTNELIGKNHLRLQNVDSAFFYFRKARNGILNSIYSKSCKR